MNILNTFNVSKYEANLKNGIKIVLFYRAGAPITTNAVISIGSNYDPNEKFGMVHFLEHMIVNGSKDFPNKSLLAEHIESVGGGFGALTGQDYLMITTEVSEKEDYFRVVDIFKATLCEPLFDKDVFENEKKIVIKEINKSKSNPSKMLIDTARGLFFDGTSFSHPVLGNEKDILALNYDDVVEEYKNIFNKSKITFVASGDISIDELTQNLNKLDFIENEKNIIVSDEIPFSNNKIKSTFFDVPNEHICFGVLGPKSFTSDSIRLNLLGDILAGGRNSRLTKKLRYEKGLVYGIGHGRLGGQDLSLWGLFTDTGENNLQDVVSEIIAEIKNIQSNGVTNEELEFVKSRRIKSLKRSMQTSSSWVDFHCVAEAFNKKDFDMDFYINTIQDTTREDIKNIIDKYLGGDKWKLAICGKTKAEDIKIS
ncbi:MAG: pitrilysin family protein [Candidatus Pacebacteria bacterium]|nr:pitrilysin family protein [Candidatus Paceibacterota bacterium]